MHAAFMQHVLGHVLFVSGLDAKKVNCFTTLPKDCLIV